MGQLSIDHQGDRRLRFAEHFDVHAQVGVAYTKTHTSSSTVLFVDSPGPKFSPVRQSDLDNESQSAGLFYGAGAAVELGKRWELSLDWQRYQVSEDDQTPIDLDAAYDAITIGLSVGFGA